MTRCFPPVVSRHLCVLRVAQSLRWTRSCLERQKTRSSRSVPAGHHAEIYDCHGLLPFQQCSHCGPSCAATLWRRTRGDCRFRCPSRQWLPANLLERSGGDVLFDSRDAALSSVRASGPSAANTTTSSMCRLRAGDGGETFREALDIAILPRLQDFSPDLIVISAGFDAHRLDPLANLKLSEADSAGRPTRLWRSLI